MSVYLTSDLHLGHKLTAHLRGFASIPEHDAELIDGLAALDKRAVLWVLGDVCLARESLPLFEHVRCRMRIVRGNHDNYATADYARYFEHIHGALRYKRFWLTHIPIHPQEMWRCRGNIHGHIHKDAATPPLPMPYFNVNWDFWRRPVALDEIRAEFDAHEVAN